MLEQTPGTALRNIYIILAKGFPKEKVLWLWVFSGPFMLRNSVIVNIGKMHEKAVKMKINVKFMRGSKWKFISTDFSGIQGEQDKVLVK